MIIVVENPRISTDVGSCFNDSVSTFYKENVQLLLKKTLPEKLFFAEDLANAIQKRLNYLNDSLPIVQWAFPEKEIGYISVVLVCRHRLNACSFFYDMISRWLIPNKRLNIEFFFAADFRLPELTNFPFNVSEIGFYISNKNEMEQFKNNLSAIETEIRLGVVSSYHANRILEYKGLSQDGKTAMIQEKIGSLIQARSEEYDKSIFKQMQHFLINCQEEFKNIRDYHHISRIISIMHTIRKVLKQKITDFPDQRHLIVKFLKTKLKCSNKERFALGIMVGLNFLKKREVFERAHLIRAIKDYINNIQCFENSFFLDKNRENSIQTIYLEIEKNDGKDFTIDEIKLLRSVLPEHLKGYIEHLMQPIFMPRNEEEILKNIMILSKQLRYINDIPQLIVSFEEQKEDELAFTVTMLRILNSHSKQIESILSNNNSQAKLILERIKKVGVIRKKYYKEACVFKVLLNKSNYFRTNLSVNLHSARQDVIEIMQELFGDIRDYNGGMIKKQGELFQNLKEIIGKQSMQNEIILEKFFFSLFPVEFRSTLLPESLKTLYLMLLNEIKKWKHFKIQELNFKEDARALYIMIPLKDIFTVKRLKVVVEKQKIPSYELVHCQFEPNEIPFFGLIYLTSNRENRQSFLQTIQAELDI
jgi:hypothetical protein